MINNPRRWWRLLAHVVLPLVCVSAASAQDFPSSPIRLVVSVPAGGPLDALARVVAEGASTRLKQPVIVDNKPGATGAVAIQYLKRQPADGYTLYLSVDPAFTLVPLVRTMPYKPMEDFTFIAGVAYAPNVLAVNASLPVKTLREFADYAKANPGKLNMGTLIGTPYHVDLERFMKATGTEMMLVPFQGGPPIVQAMLSGSIEGTLFNPALVADLARAGKVRVLATTAKRRLATMPDVPTLAEAGFPDLKLTDGQIGVIAGPAGMSKPVADRLYEAFRDTMADPAVHKRLDGIGWYPGTLAAEPLRKRLQDDLRDNERLVKALNIKVVD